MRKLGFTLESSPNMNQQVDHLKRKFCARAWVVRHLKRAGLSKGDLVLMYKTLVRPVLDYMAAVYHPMLSLDQTKEQEKLQMGTLKTIFGYDLSYRKALDEAGLETLHERRQLCFDKFAIKLSDNPEYQEWLPKTRFVDYDLREELVFEEFFAATEIALYMLSGGDLTRYICMKLTEN